ncbi:hypothetical protein MNBD_ALPHA12-2010 [hydrothermal vent metagenome]|uniref:Uncharacterized protein n=1 Tax=hydrothermal vent metagenome TaxID=652676 RepID=A0A3B0UNR3_9ZZZZ
MSANELTTKLKSIQDRIEQKRAELEQRGVLNKDHKITQQELNKRARILKKQLDEEVSSLQTTTSKVNELEVELLNWLNSVDLDAK